MTRTLGARSATRRRWWLPALSLLLLVILVVDLRWQPGGVSVTRAVDDVSQLLAAFSGAAACGWRAVHARGRTRTSWWLLAVGAGCWGSGETIWSYYELIAHTQTPFPSLADLGFLTFPLVTGIGIVVRPSRAFGGRGWARIALDMLLVVVSLLSISWVTTLGETYRGGADSKLGLVVALAYPAGDVALLTVVVVIIAYASVGDRVGLWWLGAGLTSFAVADSGFAYLTATGSYHTGNLIDACWVAGFLIIASGAVLDRSAVHESSTSVSLTPRSALLLPYLPAGVGVSASVWHVSAAGQDVPAIVLGAATVWLLMVRQVLVLLENRSLLQRMSYQALHDVLTGLGNRALFADRLDHALALHSRDRRPVSLLLIDLDDFKAVNDTLGHPAGDELLVRISERLLAAVRAADTVARLGGDEFAILIEDDDPYTIARRVSSGLEQPVIVGNRRIQTTSSIGLATLDADAEPASATDLLRRADIALYEAKREGKRQLIEYTPAMSDSGADELDLRAAISADLEAGRISCALQVIQRPDGSQFGWEALARWQHGGQSISPARFLPLAARLGLAARLDELVLTAALAAIGDQPSELRLSVNFSGETLVSPGLPARVAGILARSGFAPDRLIVEVLESSLVEQDELALRTLTELRDLGVGIAVDDFGAGFASVARLHALQPDIVKIDRSVVWAHAAADSISPLLDGITHLAHRFGSLVIAEGIETSVQFEAASAAGCDAVQGYLLGRPELVPVVRDQPLTSAA